MGHHRRQAAGISARDSKRSRIARRIITLALAATVSFSGVANASSEKFLFRYNGNGPTDLSGAVPSPTNPTEPGTTDREQLVITAPSSLSFRNFDAVPDGVAVVPQNNVGTVSYSISPALPQGLVLGADGRISGKAMAQSPLMTYTITATDGVGGSLGIATAAMELAVDARIPLSVSGPDVFAFEQYETTVSLRLSPGDDVTIHGAPIWAATTALPSWMTSTPEGNDLILSGAPTAIDASGSDIGFTLSDDHGISSEHLVHVTVAPPASAEIALPTAIPNGVVFLAAYYADIAASTTFTKVPHEDVTWSVVPDLAGDALPPGLELTADGTLQGQPLALGTFQFAIRAEGPGGTSDQQRYSITVYSETVSRVASGAQTTCLAMSDGDVKCWGNNPNGLLGNNSQVSTSAAPVDATILSGPFVDVAGGYSGHMCALKNDGTVWCWGLGSNGQLGNGSNASSRTAVQATGLTDVVSLIAGYRHTCATKANGSMWCWGQAGTIGDGSSVNKNTPQPVNGMESGVIGMAAGNSYSCATKSDGSAWCWGSNGNGRLGDGTTTTSFVPVRVKNVTNLIAMTGGYDHTCATRADRTVWCWGAALNGQLGNGVTSGDFLEPLQVPGIDNVWVLSTGDHHNCAVKLDRTAWCWGKNNHGQLGNGLTANASGVVQVLNMDNVTSISAIGYTHTCATRSDGSAWCWGENNYGQLGNDNLGTRSLVPVRVNGT